MIRPMTLILPVFIGVFVAFLKQDNWSTLIKYIFIFTLGMACLITPYTIRNYVLTKKFIPVNAQSGAVLWAATEEAQPLSSNHFNWWNIWYTEGVKIYQDVVGKTEYSYQNHHEHNLILEAAFKKKAWANFKKQPQVYLSNAMNKFISFNWDININGDNWGLNCFDGYHERRYLFILMAYLLKL